MRTRLDESTSQPYRWMLLPWRLRVIFNDRDTFQNEIFDHIDFHEQTTLSKEFDECTFDNCDLNQSEFKHCTFSNCTFTHCNISMARFTQSRFTAPSFESCKMMGINWCNSEWPKRLIFPVHFKNSVLNYSIFIGLDLQNAEFIDCQCKNVAFEAAHLANALFHKSDLEGSNFLNTNLFHTDFSGAYNYAIDVRTNHIKKTKFSYPEVISLLHHLDIVIE